MANLKINCPDYDNIVFEPKLLVRLGVLGVVCRLHFLQRLMQFRALQARKTAHNRRQTSGTQRRPQQTSYYVTAAKRRRGSCAAQACTRTRGGRTSSADALPTITPTATTAIATNRARILVALLTSFFFSNR